MEKALTLSSPESSMVTIVGTPSGPETPSTNAPAGSASDGKRRTGYNFG